MDLEAVGTALASTFAAVNAPSGTLGGTAIKHHSVGVQNLIGLPAIVVELPSGEVESETQGDRRITHDFGVYFLFGKASGDIPRDTRAMLRWLGPLLGALATNNRLGLGAQSGWNVLKTRIVSFEPGQYDVGGQPYHAWHLIVRVWTSDVFTIAP